MYTYLYAIFSAEIVALIIGLFFWNKLPLAYKLIWLQVLCAFTVEVIGLYLNLVKYPNNAWLYNIYMFLEMWVLWAVAIMLTSNKNFKNIVIIALTGMTAYWIYKVVNNNLNVFYNWFVVICALLSIAFYIYVLVNNSVFSKKRILKQPVFLIALSIIIYYASIIPLFGLLNYLIANNIMLANKLFSINISVVIIRYSLIALAFYLYGRQAKKEYVHQ